MIIYKTTCLIDGKVYIGQSINNDPNYLGSGIKIKNAINKYGASAFTKDILFECLEQEELDEAEIYWIKFFNSTDPKVGLNIHPGGSHFRPKDGTTAEKISKTLKGRKLPKETCEKMSKSRSGENHWTKRKPYTEEHKRKLSEAHKGKKASKETREKMSESGKKAWKENPNRLDYVGEKNPFFGKKHSEESKAKMRKSRAKKHPDNHGLVE